MKLRQLSHLLALAELGSFNKAAERMNLTQSALSRSIQGLEDELGVRLIDRGIKGNSLTPMGKAVATRARRVLVETDDLRRDVELLKGAEIGHLRVGMGFGPSAMLTEPFLIHMAKAHPQVQVTVSRGSAAMQLAQLYDRVLDCLIMDLASVPPAPELAIDYISEMRVGFACRKDHPLCQNGKRPITFAELRGYPIGSTPLSDEFGHFLVRHYGIEAHPASAVTLRCEEIASLVNTVLQSDAIYLGTLGSARAQLEAGTLVALQIEPPLTTKVRYGLVTLTGRTASPALMLFSQFVTTRLHD